MGYRIGTCGWSYEDWKGTFYPEGTKDELAFYASRFDTVEIDSTWYRIPSSQTVRSWQRRTPEGFLFCPKLPGEITHERMLEGVDHLVTAFLGVISALGDKLGPILIQLAPKFAADQLPKLRAFLTGLPDEFRYAVEFRHHSWLKEPAALALLSDLRMGVAMAHHPWYPRFETATTDFAYLRLLGRHGVFPDFSRVHQVQDDALERWAGTVRALSSAARAFIFVNNQFEGHSPATIERLRPMLAR